MYAGGHSEELIGQCITDRKLRDRIVLATKFSFSAAPGGPNANAGNPNLCGNGRKNIYRALEGSLRRLKTDYIDLYWMHVWDSVTPVEELLQSLGDLVREGKIRYFALSDLPAWYATKAATLAQVYHVPGPIALQMEYSLVERSIEQEHVSAARDCGLSIVPWSPLAGGFLSGKYERGNGDRIADGEGRLNGANPFGDSKFTDRNWDILDVLRAVAGEINKLVAQVALAWLLAQPGVGSVLIGATKTKQLADNIASLAIQFTSEQLQKLTEASAPVPVGVYPIFMKQTQILKNAVFNGTDVQSWQ
ncbi:aldo/keto reductase [Fibrisoma montanum]|uniref:aldo/keto reductase n=1 Tax=Fibrisoma montanum TaxID=2305895 RepID=UPI001E463502|nr:aldo/keto reductase [Fibrisoma montanum]